MPASSPRPRAMAAAGCSAAPWSASRCATSTRPWAHPRCWPWATAATTPNAWSSRPSTPPCRAPTSRPRRCCSRAWARSRWPSSRPTSTAACWPAGGNPTIFRRTSDMDIDALVVGGSFAGISAALQLARARRRVAVVDAGAPRNRFADASHGFFGHDGRAPLDLIAQAREQLLAYPSVRFVAAQALEAAPRGEGFALALDTGERLLGRRLLLATGVRDLLPDLPGLAARWGRSVAHCPYCHGYEFDRQPLGVLYRMPLSLHQAQLIAEWGPTTLLLDGHAISDEERAHMAALGIAIEPGKVLALEGEGGALTGVRLADRGLP